MPAFAAEAGSDEVVQYAVISSLVAGVYDSDATFDWVKKNGDFGIGTFNGVDGEMLAFDGHFYQIKSDGKAYEVNDAQHSPFFTLTSFVPDKKEKLPSGLTYAAMPKIIESGFPSLNYIYAIRIDGMFDQVRARSVSAQKKPYKKLSDVAKTQSIFDLKQVEGTMVGYWFPAYASGVNVPGFHLHFLTKDKKAGGHVLEFTTRDATLQRETKTSLRMILPEDEAFQKTDFSQIKSYDINRVEK
ncbi:MAG: acetolactate decarboxylase [Rickettsiales bacterium]